MSTMLKKFLWTFPKGVHMINWLKRLIFRFKRPPCLSVCCDNCTFYAYDPGVYRYQDGTGEPPSAECMAPDEMWVPDYDPTITSTYSFERVWEQEGFNCHAFKPWEWKRCNTHLIFFHPSEPCPECLHDDYTQSFEEISLEQWGV